MRRNLLLLLVLGLSPLLILDLFSEKKNNSVVVKNFQLQFLNEIENLEEESNAFYKNVELHQNFEDSWILELKNVKGKYQRVEPTVKYFYPDIAEEINRTIFNEKVPKSKKECENRARDFRALVRRIEAFTNTLQASEGEVLEVLEMQQAYNKSSELIDSTTLAGKDF